MKYSPRFTYTFTPGSATLNLSANSGFALPGLLAVVDVTAATTIYAVGQTGLSYSAFSAGTITLQAPMTGLLATDVLEFFYDDGTVPGLAMGDTASAATDAGNPVKIGGQARTANPVAVANGQRVNATFDKLGKLIAVGAVRELKGKTHVTITASTAETTIVAAGAAGVFNDVYGLILTNNGSAPMAVSIRDATAGTVFMVFQVPSRDTRGVMLPVDSAWVQAAAANNWTAACTPNATSADITAFYVQNL